MADLTPSAPPANDAADISNADRHSTNLSLSATDVASSNTSGVPHPSSPSEASLPTTSVVHSTPSAAGLSVTEGAAHANGLPPTPEVASLSSQDAAQEKTQEAGADSSQGSPPTATKTPKDKKPPFTTKKGISKESDIKGAAPSTILNFGEGLQMKVDEKGVKSFQQRYCVVGKGSMRSLGKYPEMTFEQALVAAINVRTEVKLERQKKSYSAFKARLRKSNRENKNENENPLIFKLDQAGQFIRDLFADKTLDEEIRKAIWLLMLIPSKQSELLRAKWQEIDFVNSQWLVNFKNVMNPVNNGRINSQIAFLSERAIYELNELKKLTGNSEYLFPKLAKHGRDKLISNAIENIGLNYPSEPNVFRNFFIAMAKHHSFYRPEFVEDMLAHSDGNNAVQNNNYSVQNRFELAKWWGDALNQLKFVNKQQPTDLSALIIPPEPTGLFYPS